MYKIVFVYCLISSMLFSCVSLVNKEKAVAYFQNQVDKSGPENSGPEPDYSKLEFWAASPLKVDSSDIIPKGVGQKGDLPKADVFFIHPTTYISSNGNSFELSELSRHPFKGLKILKASPWNADLVDDSVNVKTDILSIANQATAFNGSAQVYAPRYRQANIKAFIAPKGSSNAEQAFDLAYQDVKNAFEYYLKNFGRGRPIVIASHSQGALHAERLLKEFFDEKPLMDRLVVAYLVGYTMSPNAFKAIPIGSHPLQTGSVVGWQSFNEDASFTKEELESFSKTIAVNPLSWTTSEEWAEGTEKQRVLDPQGSIVSETVSARIDEHGRLMVKTPDSLASWLKGSKNYHVWDYNLFWESIRTNVEERIDAFNRCPQLKDGR